MSDWEDVPKQSSTDGWEDVSSSSFKSGQSFKATKDTMPDMSMSEAWDEFKKQWANRANTPMTADDRKKMMAGEHAAGSAILDTVGGIPAMAAGGIHGLYTGLTQMDATKGLAAANKTVGDLLPSSLMGNQEDQNNPAYHATMLPVTAAMDTLNAAPEGYGEILNAAGYNKAAAQVSDAGKLGILAGAGIVGMKGMTNTLRGKKEVAADHAAKIEGGWEDVPAPKASEAALADTAAHADDFAAINPYDVGGHVTKAQEGAPSLIDHAQGELFGGEVLQDAQRAPELPVDSLLKTPDNAIPYTKEFPFALEDQAAPAHEMGINMPEKDGQLSLVPKEDMSVPKMNETRVYPEALAENRAKAEAPAELPNAAMQEAMVKAERDQAFKALEETAQMQKEAHFQALEHLEIANRHGDIDYQHVKDMGDRTLMDKAANESMTRSIGDGNLTGAIEAIAKNHPERTFRDLATYLMDKVEGIKTQLHPEAMIKAGDRDVSGYFDPNTGVVGYSGIGAASPHTVMHETVHALTSQFMQGRPNDVRTVAVKNLYNKLSDKMAKEFPGVVNAREFVAEAFSNPKFQEFLKGQRIDNRSAFQRFVDGVKTMLGMKTNAITSVTNALTHAIDLSKQVIEASDKNTRNTIMETFKSAGMSNKLADLMAEQPRNDRPVEVVRNGNVKDVTRKIPGLTDAISDFKFYDKSPAEIAKMAAESPDISNTMVEKFAQQMQAGALFESLKTRNPVIKYTYERITRAFQEASKLTKDNLTSPETGLKRYMRDMTPDQKGEIHSLMMLNEGVKELSSHELAERGFNEKQIAYYNKYRELSQKFFDDINTRRVAMGMEPMDQRVAHIAGRFMGDFSQIVTAEVPHPTTGNMQTKVVGRISGSTKWELQRAQKFMQEQHPEWSFNKPEYNSIGKGRNAADRFGGLMEAINFITKTDSDAAALMSSYREYIQSDAVNYLNATRHAKAKVVESGGIKGSEGNKPWLDVVKNAEEGMKAQLSYFEQGYQWMAMEKAVGDLKPVFGDEAVAKATPNAVAYATKYVDHAMGRNQGKISDAANVVVSMLGEYSGLGHTNILKANNTVKHLMMQKFMGLLNIPFSVTQFLQPLQTQPAMLTLLKGRGLEFSVIDAQKKATETYLRALMEGHSSEKLSPFERAAIQYSDQAGIFDVKMTDHTKDINASRLREGYSTLADLNITAPEHLTRGMSFLLYSHVLKDAGVPVKDIFGAAENMTNMTMVNYHPIERPMGYAKLGWIGDVASTLTRYKHNQYSQMAFYGREAIRSENGVKSSAPLAAFLGTSLAMGGIMGMFAYNEADALYQTFRESVLKSPDTLANQMFKNNVPEYLTHGVFSTLGLDMTSRFSNANLIPDNIGAAVMPYGSAVLDMAESTGRFVLDPTNDFKQKQWVKSMAPQSASGLLENKLFTEKSANGKNLYISSTDGPNLGKGRVERSDSDMKLRAWGFRDIRESKELANNYSNSQISKSHKNIADGLLEKAKYSILGNNMTQESMQKIVQQAAQHGESPDSFISKLSTWSVDRKIPQSQQQLLRDAQSGFKGSFNLQQQGQR